ncbi:hypothetical protein Ahy_B02g059773 isoform A [Arachis hypogaea]|uniref:Protein kinase domain-containing protein n=1 Tax=Arachis hypogaea TaxID=3818 RepID=A0A445AH87_ARAHY|nr:hypothetical protein Ahy_B02g059773 isoform A [Arachis hypogaea]
MVSSSGISYCNDLLRWHSPTPAISSNELIIHDRFYEMATTTTELGFLRKGSLKQFIMMTMMKRPMLRRMELREQDDYEVVRKVGRGKYSEVFEGVHSHR